MCYISNVLYGISFRENPQIPKSNPKIESPDQFVQLPNHKDKYKFKIQIQIFIPTL